jgi:serine/threonine protein kinase
LTDPAARLTAALEGRYQIVRELGAGGMATVYLAEDLKQLLAERKPREALDGLARERQRRLTAEGR